MHKSTYLLIPDTIYHTHTIMADNFPFARKVDNFYLLSYSSPYELSKITKILYKCNIELKSGENPVGFTKRSDIKEGVYSFEENEVRNMILDFENENFPIQ